jgi:hypothetical protein
MAELLFEERNRSQHSRNTEHAHLQVDTQIELLLDPRQICLLLCNQPWRVQKDMPKWAGVRKNFSHGQTQTILLKAVITRIKLVGICTNHLATRAPLKRLTVR